MKDHVTINVTWNIPQYSRSRTLCDIGAYLDRLTFTRKSNMCRFSAIISTKPVAIADIVTRPRSSIIYQSYNAQERVRQKNILNSYHVSSLNGDGYGIGWYVPEELANVTDAPNEPCIFVSTRPAWTDLNLVSIAEKTASRTVFAHVRAASTGYVSEGSCHPFKHGRFMFMHNGMIGDWDRVRSEAVKLVPDELFDFVICQGAIDSVFIFAVFLSFLPRTSIDLHRPQEIRMAFANMIDVLICLHHVLQINSHSMINICISDGQTTICSRLLLGGGNKELMSSDNITESNAVDASLYFTSGSSWDPDTDSSQSGEIGDLDYVMTQKDRQQNTVIISSEPLSSSLRREWVPVNPQHVLVVDKNCNVLQEEIQDCPWSLENVTLKSLGRWLRQMYRQKLDNVEIVQVEKYRLQWDMMGVPLTTQRYSIYNNTVLEHCLSAMNLQVSGLESATSLNTQSLSDCVRRNSISLDLNSPTNSVNQTVITCNHVMTPQDCSAPILTVEPFEITDSFGQKRPMVIAGHENGTTRVWDLLTGQCVAVTSFGSTHQASVRSIIVIRPEDGDPSDFLFLTGSSDSTVRFWSLSFLKNYQFGSDLMSPRIIDFVGKIQFIPIVGGVLRMVVKSDYLVLGLWNTNLYRVHLKPIISALRKDDIHKLQSPENVPMWWTITNDISKKSFDCEHPNGSKLTVEKFFYTNQIRHVGFVECIINIEGTNIIVSSGADGIIIFWDFDNISSPSANHKLGLSGRPGRIYSLAYSSEKNLIISGGEHGRLRLWDASTGMCLGTAHHRGSDDPVLTIHIEGETCVIGSSSGVITLLDLNSLTYDCELVDCNGGLLCAQNQIVAVRQEGGLMDIYSAGVDGGIRVWNSIDRHDHVAKDEVNGFVRKQMNNVVNKHLQLDVLLREFVAIKSISSSISYLPECYRAARFLASKLDALGCVVSESVADEGGPPLVLGRFGSDPKKPTILFYGHYDVISAPNTAKNIPDNQLNFFKFSEGTPSPRRSRVSSPMSFSNDSNPTTFAELWSSDPWQLVQKNGYYLGRGACDNKGPICAQISAVSKLICDGEELGSNVMFLYEGEEETGSTGFRNALSKVTELFSMTPVDAVIVNNATGVSNLIPSIITSMRGVVEFRIEISNLINSSNSEYLSDGFTLTNEDGGQLGVHSGEKGGSIAEPMSILCKIIADLKDAKGHICIPELYPDPSSGSLRCEDDIDREISDFIERVGEDEIRNFFATPTIMTSSMHDVMRRTWMEPTVSIGEIYSSASCPSSGSEWAHNFRIQSSTVGCNVSLRIISGTSKKDAVDAFETYLKNKFSEYRPNNQCSLKFRVEQASDAWDCYEGDKHAANKLIALAKDAMREVWSAEPLLIREGGTMAIIRELQNLTGAPTINIPLAGPSDNAHMPNERVRCQTLINAKQALKYLIQNMTPRQIK
eukprot:GHVH01000681.1.p1 GENE.GHVH01000681.1~~GHVH01000681.1.p1  ORF type:complete len:1428 (+),score=194.08 GHVH01000681.1:2264-6547(+)